MILFSHPTGNANARHAALALRKEGLLGEFWTTINYRGPKWLEKSPLRPLVAQLKRRSYAEELQAVIHTRPLRELLRLLCSRYGSASWVRHETGFLSVDAVYRDLDKRTARRLKATQFTGAYAYEDGALETFRAATRLGLRKIYDQPIGYWRAARDLLLEEAALRPEWAMTLIGNEDSRAKTDRKDEELLAADLVVVASSFTEKTLLKAPGFKAPVIRIPYGAPINVIPESRKQPRRPGTKLKALYVGSLGQRKGLSYLFEACKEIHSEVELTVIGRKPESPCPALDKALASVRWIPSCPHQEVLAHMAASDVFVFPSLFEGFGLVLLEAMAMGLPIICTEHTAGPDLITHGKEGFIIPIRDSDAIAGKLLHLSSHHDLLDEQSKNATLRAATFTWETYEEQLAQAVKQVLRTSNKSC